jgi:hypothetical protein
MHPETYIGLLFEDIVEGGWPDQMILLLADLTRLVGAWYD